MDRYCGTDPETLEALLRVAVALGLGEIAARDVGVQRAGTIRRNVNVTEVPYNRQPNQAPALSPAEIIDVIRFLGTLTDGYRVP